MWQERANCATTETALFFPTREDPDSAKKIVQAKMICAGCPVICECLSYALADDSIHGVWGGTSHRERKRMRGLRRSG